MVPRRERAHRLLSAAVVAAVLAAPAGASAAGPAPRAHAFDVRAASAGAPAGPAERAERARAALRRRFGSGLALGVDPATGTTRTVQRLDGALTGPASGPRATVARDWLHSQHDLLGLDAAAADDLTVASDDTVGPQGVTTVRFVQHFRGLPVFDGGVQVALDRGGRVLAAAGTPAPDPSVASVTPALDAAEATRSLERDTGPGTAVDGSPPRLLVFPAPGGARLAWRVIRKRETGTTDEAVVDAASGRILFRQSLTKFDAQATSYPSFPGADSDPNHPGTQAANAPVTLDLEARGWLTPGARNLTGPYAHAYSDVNDDDVAQASEEVARTPANATTPNSFVFPLRTYACTSGPAWCTWQQSAGTSVTNRQADTVQSFTLVGRYHDHLAADPIDFDGFGPATNGTAADPVRVETLDGASTALGGGPDASHINNANMTTLPEGYSPRMQMYLFRAPYRAVDGGDDAATVWHEYTHGLSGRLVVHPDDGSSALSSVQSGAMGEGWSDFYALDYLDRLGLQTDDPSVFGDVDIGRASDLRAHDTRTQGADCPVTPPTPAPSGSPCPGAGTAGAWGYTLGDLGRIFSGPEVHADGEIWLETLWDLRRALITRLQSTDAGSNAVEGLVTEAMRLSPPEPSLLDERDAILAADTAAGGANHNLIWDVFAARGMGWFAGDADATDVHPVEDFHTQPDAGAATGTLTGRVTDADTGAPLADVTVGPPSRGGASWTTTTGADGRYTLTGLPAGTYGRIQFTGPAGYDATGVGATVVDGSDGVTTTTLDRALHRDWASAAGGGSIAGTVDPFCGAGGLIDESPTTDWSSDVVTAPRQQPSVLIRLPATIDVSAVGIDPAAGCGDDSRSALRGYALSAVHADGSEAPLASGSFSPSAAGTLNPVTPTGNARSVVAVRLQPLSAQSSSAAYVDVAALSVYGTPSQPGAPAPPASPPAPSQPAPATSTAVTTQPTTPVVTPAPPLRRIVVPTVRISATGRRGAVTTVMCASRCSVRGVGTLAKAVARRARSARTVVSARTTLTAARTTRVTFTLSSTARTRLRRAKLKAVTVALKVRATDADGQTTVRSAHVRVSL